MTNPTATVDTTTATIAIMRMGPMSSINRRTFMASAVSNSRTGRITNRKVRSEDHTSELQSLMRISYAVLCLKKKITPFKTVTNDNLYIQHTLVYTTSRIDSSSIRIHDYTA